MKLHDTFRGTRAEEGFGILASLLVMTLISILGAALLTAGMSDLGASDNYRGAKQAFYAADAGLQQSLIDFVADNTWAPTIVDASSLPIVPKINFPATVSISNQAITLAQQGGNPVAKFYDFGPTVPFASAVYDRELFLPPTDADGFFQKLGFKPVPPERAPERIRDSRELRELWPESETLLRLSLA